MLAEPTRPDHAPERDTEVESVSLPLFRPEAVEARQISSLGTLVVVPSRFGALASICGLAFLLAVVAAFLFGSYVDKVNLTGIVVAERGVVRLAANADGIVKQVLVSQGQVVTKGQILFVLGLPDESGAGPTLQQLLSGLDDRRTRLRWRLQQYEQQEAATRGLADQNIELRRRQISAIENEMAILTRRVTAAADIRNRYQVLLKQNFVTIATMQAAEEALADAQLRLSSLGRDKSQLEAQIDQSQFDRGQLPGQFLEEHNNLLREMSQVDSDIADLEARKSRVIRAPIAGVIASLDATQGEVLTTAKALGSIVPTGSRMAVDLRAPTNAVGRLAVGQSVWLRFDAFPYQRYGQFHGIVQEIANTATQETKDTKDEPYYRVRVRVEDRRLPNLRPDLTVNAGIGVGRRRLQDILFPRTGR